MSNRLAALAAILVLLVAALAPGDTIHLKDGRVLHGRLEKTDGGWKLHMPYGTLHFADGDVAKVEQGTAVPEEKPQPKRLDAEPETRTEPRRDGELKRLGAKLVEDAKGSEDAARVLVGSMNRLIGILSTLGDTDDVEGMRKASVDARRDAKRLAGVIDDAQRSGRRFEYAARDSAEGTERDQAREDLVRSFEHLVVAAQVIAEAGAVNQQIIDAAEQALRIGGRNDQAISRMRLECVRARSAFERTHKDLDALAESIRGIATSLGAPAIAGGQGLEPGQPSGERIGTGFFVSSGYVLTNAHVVGAAEKVEVEVAGAKREGAVFARSQTLDLALVKVEGVPGAPLDHADGGGQPGSTVFAYGYGTVGGANEMLLVTRGTVSAHDPANERLIFDAKVNPGNSGGPLVDADGRWVGVVVAKSRSSERDAVESLSFAVRGSAASVWVERQGVPIARRTGPAQGTVPPDVSLRAATVRIRSR